MNFEAQEAAAREELLRMAAEHRLKRPVVPQKLSSRDMYGIIQAANARAEDLGIGPHPLTERFRNDAAAEQAQAAGLPPPMVAGNVPPPAVVDPTAPTLAPQHELARSLSPAPAAVGVDPLSVHLGYSGGDPMSRDMMMESFQHGMRASTNAMHDLDTQADFISSAEAAAEQGTMQELQTNTAMNEELTPLAQEKAQAAQDHANRVAEMTKDVQARTDVQMARIRQASDEAANTQMKDFWADKSTGGRILGIISQALAGAANGLSSQPGAPTPLDRIIERDMEKQRLNMNQKVTTAYREQGILGLMHTQFKEKVDAETAAYAASLQHVGNLIEEVKQRYNTPVAAAAATKAIADLQAKKAEALTHIAQMKNQTGLQEATIAAPGIRAGVTADATVKAAELRASGKDQNGDLHILGLKGPVNKVTYAALKDHAGAVGQLMSSYDKMLDLLDGKHKIDDVWLTEMNAELGQAHKSLRVTDKTGAALNVTEDKNLHTRIPDFTAASLSTLTGHKILDYRRHINSMRNSVLRDYLGHAKAISGNDYDLGDPSVGPLMKTLATHAASPPAAEAI